MRINTIPPKLKKYKQQHKKNWKKFQLKETALSTTLIPHKTTVKYLGVTLDTQLKFFHHIDNQLTKAKIAFKALSKIFLSRYLNKNIKILCYTSLIRPIITRVPHLV